MNARILLFAKAPVAGRVKTRLIPTLGADGAARLARRMLSRTLSAARASGIAVELCGDPDPACWGPLSFGISLSVQGDGDLGQRLAHAASRTIERGQAALLIGADCPGLDAAHLRAAAAALEAVDAVIHPAEDGGYVLLGLRRFHSSLFEDIAWSSDQVARQTIARVEALGWSLEVRDTLRDIDEPDDLGALPPELRPVTAIAGADTAR
ncbi:TIGR04282 family arsenosugar biosynthesis glycosyltransferase [Sphingosinicella sp. BN140058]|uniref:TIGR04282 family arsenosugar biosynthesis glycosyltransferase n=1 Tax=Sphingosinicella sp. BN140058 TaxID=1892855 RepID=UPI00197FAB60|nr:TIGR04282 family arsenosugar biosynthesis glycosyltransferase [Sphingosinicella sp. BN140058]